MRRGVFFTVVPSLAEGLSCGLFAVGLDAMSAAARVSGSVIVSRIAAPQCRFMRAHNFKQRLSASVDRIISPPAANVTSTESIVRECSWAVSTLHCRLGSLHMVASIVEAVLLCVVRSDVRLFGDAGSTR